MAKAFGTRLFLTEYASGGSHPEEPLKSPDSEIHSIASQTNSEMVILRSGGTELLWVHQKDCVHFSSRGLQLHIGKDLDGLELFIRPLHTAERPTLFISLAYVPARYTDKGEEAYGLDRRIFLRKM